MKIIATALEGLLILEPKVFADERGYFLETYHSLRYRDVGIKASFVQDNLSFSKKNVLRGLHFQISQPQAKLVQVISGEIFDVAVDIQPGSATFGNWAGVVLSEENKRQILVPEGFAHGFCVLSQTAHVAYKCSVFYNPADEGGIRWSDPEIGIDWPVKNPILSGKDAKLPRLSELTPSQLSRGKKL
jgi:dTDP-4-dehydrorhamnose 3,5-epimerase